MELRMYIIACLVWTSFTATPQQTDKEIPLSPKPVVSFRSNILKTDSLLIRKIHGFAVEQAKQDSFSGLILVAHNNNPIYQSAFGYASKEFGVPNNFQTRFNLASMTKMFTGLAVAQLAEQGKISFNDRIDKYLPDLPKNLTGDITIHQLLTHTSGSGSFWKPEFHESNHAKFRTLKDYLKLIEKDTPLFKPGSQWAYSNSGFLLLGLLIEKISGQTYFEYVKKNVFQKAGMNASDFLETDVPNRNTANSYTKQYRYKPGTNEYYNTYFIAPVKGTSAGGAYSTAEDLLRFSTALLSYSLLNKPNTAMLISGKAPYDKPERRKKYAYGFAEQFVNDRRIVFHDGGANGVSTQMDIYPEAGYIVIVLSNYDPPAASKIATFIKGEITRLSN